MDELKGSGNHYTAEYWEIDSRLGRRWNRDPFVKHHESPYAIFANNPIWFIDPLGADTGDVAVAFGGGDFFGSGDQGTSAPAVVGLIIDNNFGERGGAAESFSSNWWSTDPNNTEQLDKATQSAFDYVLVNYDAERGGKISLYGYGGVMASHLAGRLGEAGLSVDMLVTVDAAAAWQTSDVSRTIPSNVKVNVNYYQSTSSMVGSYGGANTATGSSTKIYNFDFTGKAICGTKLKHSNIDDFSIGWSAAEMLNVITGAYRYQTTSGHKPAPR